MRGPGYLPRTRAVNSGCGARGLSLRGLGHGTEELADTLGLLADEAGLAVELLHRLLGEEVDRAAFQSEAHLANRHAPRPQARPGRNEPLARDRANAGEEGNRIRDVVEDADGDGNVEHLVGAALQDVLGPQLASIGDAGLDHHLPRFLDHGRGAVEPDDAPGAAL